MCEKHLSADNHGLQSRKTVQTPTAAPALCRPGLELCRLLSPTPSVLKTHPTEGVEDPAERVTIPAALCTDTLPCN